MKHSKLYYLPLLVFHVISAETTPPAPAAPQQTAPATNPSNPTKPPRDYTPEILGTFFQSIVPHFLHMAAAAQAEDTEQQYQAFAGIFQGIGAIIDYGTRALKDNPSLDISKTLLAFMQSAKGKQLLINSKSS